MSKLEISGKAHDAQTPVWRVAGALYGTPEAYAFQNEVRERIVAGARRIVLDLGAVDRIDSSGVGILVAIMFSASNAGGSMVLAAIPPRVKNVLGIAMLLDRIEQADSVGAALAGKS
jgi:anti-sigma B factor antagonist